jgi:hypothetical protein
LVWASYSATFLLFCEQETVLLPVLVDLLSRDEAAADVAVRTGCRCSREGKFRDMNVRRETGRK